MLWPFFRPAQSLAGLRKSGWLASKAKWKPCLLKSPHLGGLMLCHKGDRVHKLSHSPTGRRTRVEPVGLCRLLNSCQRMSFLGASWKTQHLQGSGAALTLQTSAVSTSQNSSPLQVIMKSSQYGLLWVLFHLSLALTL